MVVSIFRRAYDVTFSFYFFAHALTPFGVYKCFLYYAALPIRLRCAA